MKLLIILLIVPTLLFADEVVITKEDGEQRVISVEEIDTSRSKDKTKGYYVTEIDPDSGEVSVSTINIYEDKEDDNDE